MCTAQWSSTPSWQPAVYLCHYIRLGDTALLQIGLSPVRISRNSDQEKISQGRPRSGRVGEAVGQLVRPATGAVRCTILALYYTSRSGRSGHAQLCSAMHMGMHARGLGQLTKNFTICMSSSACMIPQAAVAIRAVD